MRISERIHAAWREVEDILTAATGPILIAASALAAADIFSNHAFSNQYPWIPAAWAVARALAVTIWLGIAWEFYLTGRERGAGGWWLLLALALFGVDLQTALLFAIQDEHLRDVGTIPFVTIPAIYWVFEQAILGVVLIAVHRAVVYQTHAAAQLTIAHAVTVPALVRPTTQPDDEAGMAGAKRIARRAYWDGPYAPVSSEDGVRMELVTDEQSDRPTEHPKKELTRQTRAKGAGKGDGRRKPRRRDAGRETPAKEQRIIKLMAQLRKDPTMTIENVADFLDVSRGTAVTDRAEAKRRLREEQV